MLGSLLSLGALLSEYHVVFDLLSHFRVQYICLIAIAVCVSLFARAPVIFVLTTLCLSVHVYAVATTLMGKPTNDTSGPIVRVMTSNLLASNRNYREHIDFINATDPDVIVFQEYTSTWDKALSTSLKQYTYKLKVPIETPFGIALYSKFPLLDNKELALIRRDRPTVTAIVSIEDKTIKIIGTHPPPPMSAALYAERNSQLQKLAGITKTSDIPTVLLGDLNITPWSAHYKQLIKNGELLNSRQGHGLFTSWPTTPGVLQIPIDHILHSHDIRTLSMGSSEDLDSDHKSLWAEIQIN